MEKSSLSNFEKYFFYNPATKTIILINILIFFLITVFSNLTEILLLHPDIQVILDKPWTLITVFFSHEILIHIILNMVLLLVFGTQLEKETNASTAISVYFFSGFAGSLTVPVFAPLIEWSSFEPISGASAAVFGIVAAFAALKPNFIIFKSKAKIWMIALFIVNILLLIQNPQISVGGASHAVGIIAGLIYGYWFRKRKSFN